MSRWSTAQVRHCLCRIVGSPALKAGENHYTACCEIPHFFKPIKERRTPMGWQRLCSRIAILDFILDFKTQGTRPKSSAFAPCMCVPDDVVEHCLLGLSISL